MKKLFVVVAAFLLTTDIAKSSTEAIVQAALPAFVTIAAKTSSGTSLGSGFIVKADGVIVTNLHVIEGATEVAVKLGSGEVHTRVKVASFDEQRDLAILRIPGFGLPVLPLGNSDKVKQGASVIAIGNPEGLEHTVTKGIVSSLRVRKDGTKIIQTDTAISSGSSGGPLLNSKGSVVGIVTFKMVSGESLNFAIPVNYARGLLGVEQLMTLAEMNEELSGSSGADLFASSGGNNEFDVSGTWKSLVSNRVREIKQDADGRVNFFVENKVPIPNHLSGQRGSIVGTMTIQSIFDGKIDRDGKIVGESTEKFRCFWVKWGAPTNPHWKTCTYGPSKYEMQMVSANRIKGKVSSALSPKEAETIWDLRKICKKCSSKPGIEEIDFVWIRE